MNFFIKLTHSTIENNAPGMLHVDSTYPGTSSILEFLQIVRTTRFAKPRTLFVERINNNQKMARTRLSSARPDCKEHLQNAARRSRVKKSIEKAQQGEAFKELISLMGANGGKVPYGGLDKIVKTYNQNGIKAVTRQNLYYRLHNLKSGKTDDRTNVLGCTIAASGASQEVISDITEERILTDVSNTEQSIPPNAGGRKKGSTNILE